MELGSMLSAGDLVLGITAVSIIGFLVFCLFQITRLKKQLNSVESQQPAQEILLEQLKQNLVELQEQQLLITQELSQTSLENQQVSQQLEIRIKQLRQDMENQQQQIELMNQNQPEDKLYSRALKLVSLGADVEEVMRECELPRAEAEMLFSVHQKRQS